MSWLTDTIGKVREQGSSLVSAAKQVRSRLSSEHGDADAHLESKVLSAVAAGPGAAEQLCQAWSRQLNTAASVSGSIANDAFWQTLLRSRAAELMLQGHSAHHASPASPYDGSALRLLIARVLPDDHAALGQEMVTLITGERGDLASDDHTRFASELLSSTKVDWRSEAYLAERLELIKAAEKQSQDLQKLGIRAGEPLDRPAQRVQISSQLLGNYEELSQSLEEAAKHCVSTAEARKQSLTMLLDGVEAYATSLEGEAVGHKQKSLQANLRQSHDSLSQELAKIDEQRESADRKIESLETQKLHIRQKLQSVDDKLHAAREVQRSCFAERDACRKAVADIEGQFRLQLREAEEEGLLATKEHEAAKKVREMAAQAESLSSQALAAAVDELKTKTVQFDSHLLTVLMDHVSQEERRIEQLGHEAEHCLQIVQKHKAEIQMLNVMDRPAHTVLDSLEHKRLRQTAVAADTALKACAAFVRDFGPFLEKNVEAQTRLKKLESDHAQVLRKLAPCREFLGVQSEASQMRGSTPTPSIPAGTLDIPRPVSQLQATSASQAMNNCMPEPSHTPPLLEDPQLELRQPGLQQDLQIMPRRDQQQQSQEPVDHKQDPSKPQGYPQPRVQPQETSQTQQLHQQQMQQEQHQYQQQQHQQPQQQQYHPQSLSIEAKQAEKT